MVIRNLEDADYTAVLSLYTQLDRLHHEARPDYFGHRECAYPKKDYDEVLADPQSLMLGAFEENEILGTVRATLWEKSGMIEGVKTVCLDNIYVSPYHRRKGVAKQLFFLVENWAGEHGAVRLYLHVWHFNRNAMALYQAISIVFQYHVMEKKL